MVVTKHEVKATGELSDSDSGSSPADQGEDLDDNGDTDDASDDDLSTIGVTRFVREWALILVIAVVVAVVVRTFILSPFYIPSSSMEPGLQINDRILVNKLSYKLHDIHRRDVIVFNAPKGVDFGPNVKDLVKRVIGLPGETLEIRDCSVFVNGTALVESYVARDSQGRTSCTTTFGKQVDPDGDGKIEVPKGYVFVLGDNRTNSDDGRTWGFLNESLILGRVFVIYWPFSHWTLL